MRFLRYFFSGQIPLWRLFWLVGLPLSILWDVTLAGMVFLGMQDPTVTVIIIGLFTLASLAMPFVAVAIWRSATNYPRETWRKTFLAWGAKALAAGSIFIGLCSWLGLMYLASLYMEAVWA
jgi:hypothetical protein